MELIINHLQKSFENKEVLKDISYTFSKGKYLWTIGKKWSR